MAHDTDSCPRCRLENARCACSKNAPNPLAGRKAELRALADSVLAELKRRGIGES